MPSALRPRVLVCLLLQGTRLVKTVRFDTSTYLGDPRNAARIFNDKEADELVLLDITATPQRRGPNFELLKEIVTESFMPVAYGGGVRSVDEVKRIVGVGVEKVILNTAAVADPGLIEGAAREIGSQSVAVSLDVRKVVAQRTGYEVFTHGGQRPTGRDPAALARQMEAAGAGELLLTAVDRDGTMSGYDLSLIRAVASAVRVPVVACGGAGSVTDLAAALHAGAAAAAAGSMFVFHGRHRAVLISFPDEAELRAAFAGVARG
ncbi:MAG: imidazole glycerol phosphate synthase subunit HisF [Myxococcales bacterium]|nr:imidazole glycerol phosphate synthase subunit HisF [Myxococcales bacterium]